MDPIEELLTRAVERIYPSKEALENVLRSGRKLRLYQGFDPTGTNLHIGHMIGLRKLRQWQDLGHHVIFLIGDGTGQAGDPSGKTKSREKFLSREELRKNATDYVKQAASIMNFEGENPVEILYNGDWLNELTLVAILNLLHHFSLQQLAERDLFQERMKRGEEVNMREFFYPLLQGYDSVAMKVDLELGGSDQTFNMLCGRKLVKDMLHKEKFVMTTPLLTDSQGRKIGKTEGNVIALTDNPKDLYAKIMALPDDVIGKAFEYLTTTPMPEVKKIQKALIQGENPMQYKKRLAYDIVTELYSVENAHVAQDHFEKTVQKKELPEEVPTFTWKGEGSVIDFLVTSELAGSRADAKRLIEQGGVTVDGNPLEQPGHETFALEDGQIVGVGKRKFVRVILEDKS